jgi:hypothetical protein
MLEQLSIHQEKKEEELNWMNGMTKSARAKWREMGFESQAAYDAADVHTKMGALQSMAVKNAQQEAELRQQEMGEKLAEMAGLRQARGRLKGMMDEAGAPNPALNLGALANPESLAPGTLGGIGGQDLTSRLSGLAQPTMKAGVLSADQLNQMALQAGIQPRDLNYLAEASGHLARAKQEGAGVSPIYDEDPVTGARMYRLGKAAIPTGMNPAMGGQLMQATDSETREPIAGMRVDSRGRVVRDRATPVPTGLSHDFNTELNKFRMEIARREANIGQTDVEIKSLLGEKTKPEAYRTGEQRKLDALKKQTKQTIDSYHSQGLFPAETRDRFYEDFGFSGKGAPAGGPAVGAVQRGYRYNGKFPPGDKRAWEKVQ